MGVCAFMGRTETKPTEKSSANFKGEMRSLFAPAAAAAVARRRGTWGNARGLVRVSRCVSLSRDKRTT